MSQYAVRVHPIVGVAIGVAVGVEVQPAPIAINKMNPTIGNKNFFIFTNVAITDSPRQF